jgi:hypothetical protein
MHESFIITFILSLSLFVIEVYCVHLIPVSP